MANLIQIKRSLNTANATSLANGELAYTANGDVLWIGSNSGVVAIGGARNPGVLTANQALVANATSGINKVIVANLVTTAITANGVVNPGAGYYLATDSGGNTYWAAPGTLAVNADAQYTWTNTHTFSNTTASTSTTTGAVKIAGGLGVAGRINSLDLATGNSTVYTTVNGTSVSTVDVFSTGTVNAVTLSVGNWVVANNGGVYTSGVVNGAIVRVGTSFAANTTRVAIGTSTGLEANGSVGTAGQVLTSNGTTVYWTTPQVGDITSVVAGNGLTGGATSGDATLDIGSGNGISVSADAIAVTGGSTLTVNSTGVHVNTANLSIATSQLTGDVALGTNTSGNYVATITAGNGISGSSSTEGGTPTIAVVAGSGIASNSTGVHVVAGNTSIVSNATGIYVNAATLSIATSQLTGDVALGTNTSGNYVATITAGNGISGSSSTEGGTPTIAVVAGTNGGLVSNSTGVFVTASDGLVVNATGLHVAAGNGISTAADSVYVNGGSTLTVNTTGAHVNTNLSITSLTLSGDLTVSGNVTTTNVNDLKVADPLIHLASNNETTDALDIGFIGHYSNDAGVTKRHVGFFRDATDGVFKLFANSVDNALDAGNTVTVNTAATGYTTATLQAYLSSGALVSNTAAVTITANSTVNVNITANSLTLSTPLAATSGGTGLNTYTSGDILVANTGNALSKLALGTSGYVLQSNGTAVVYGTLDGGTF